MKSLKHNKTTCKRWNGNILYVRACCRTCVESMNQQHLFSVFLNCWLRTPQRRIWKYTAQPMCASRFGCAHHGRNQMRAGSRHGEFTLSFFEEWRLVVVEIIVRIVWIMLMVMMMRVQMMMGIVVLMMMIMEWIVSMVMIAVVGDGIRDAVEDIEGQVAGRASVYMQISKCANAIAGKCYPFQTSFFDGVHLPRRYR